MRFPQTLQEAILYFADKQRAHDYMVNLRWPNGIACPRFGCGSADVQIIATRKIWRCKECKRDFSTKVGTIFEDSALGLDKWLPAVWLIASAKNGISSYEIKRALGLGSQRTAWFMLHRIRLAMQSKTFEKLSGSVEVDETYVGGKKRSSHPLAGRGRKSKGPRDGKTVVMGIIERRGKVRAFVVPDVTRATLHGRINQYVEVGANVYTDAWPAYRHLVNYAHYVVNHDEEYVRGHIHTNTIENFWSLLRRALRGTYIAARPFHLSRYIDEQAFRFNTRDLTDGDRFALAAKAIEGCRVTWDELTGK
jgi:transposase-like protein/IS1 family transposase